MSSRQAHLSALVLATIVAAVLPSAAGAQLGINIYGLSRHFEAADREVEEVNPGLGLHWTFDRGRRTAWEFNAGVYRDSYRNLDRHVSLGARWRIAGPLEFGLQAMWSSSRSLNGGRSVLKPLPTLSLRWQHVVLHGIYLPEVESFNGVATLGIMATVYPFGESFAWDRPHPHWDRRWSELEFGWRSFSGLAEFREYAVAWRRMRDERNGWRIAAHLDGEIRSSSRYSDEKGHYRFGVAWQRIWQKPLTKRVQGHLALGLSIDFATVDRYLEIDGITTLAVPLDIGVSFAISPELALFAESRLAWSRDNFDSGWGYPFPGEAESLGAGGTLLGLRARY